MKAGHNRDETSSPLNDDRDIRITTPTIDFDGWPEDPFTLTKESDVFASFTTEKEEMANTNSNPKSDSNSTTSPFPRSISASIARENVTLNGGKTNSNKKNVNDSTNNTTPNWKRSHSQRSHTQTNSDSKSTISMKNKLDYIPLSKRKKKPKGMPKRPLSAYNLYFQAERTNILQRAGDGPRIGFEGLGKIIGKQWRDLGSIDKTVYDKLAEKDSERYRKEMDSYHEMKAKRYEEEEKRAASQTPVLSSLTSSSSEMLSVAEATNFDANYIKQQSSIKIIPVGNGFVNSHVFTHPPQESFVSSVLTFPPGKQPESMSYHPVSMIRVEQPSSPHRHTSQQHNVSTQGPPPSPNFTQNTGDRSEYNGAGQVPGSVTYAAPRNNCQMPPGMEVVLSDQNGVDRKYRVQYTCYSMTRENANKYIESLTGAQSSAPTLLPPPPAICSNGEYADWST